jgi:hypothetical protein
MSFMTVMRLLTDSTLTNSMIHRHGQLSDNYKCDNSLTVMDLPTVFHRQLS